MILKYFVLQCIADFCRKFRCYEINEEEEVNEEEECNHHRSLLLHSCVYIFYAENI
jgi:hypothetical protein